MMYEIYVQTRDVYTANKDGVSIFISTAGTGESFPVHRAGTGLEEGGGEGHLLTRHVWTAVGPGRGIVCVPQTWLGPGVPQEAQVWSWET